MSSIEAAICDCLHDRPATIAELSAELGLSKFVAYQQMSDLARAGLVEVADFKKHTPKGGRPTRIFMLARTRKTA